eukprot:CAMPEP_0202704204 /NCGR_PEP_ID=MMETSP1385-20130828/16923_1 /ASSEMBLY_ACC=CAM_ASM_000861 /TAXON_ID=933848 /ORGANISM="Elphidium margaritaceum" /LENGTH=459 /DNA_ID=CAMNT_0049362177 /DNA_START=239 /DNA_END=1618 /DNA_ORIENTATION=+
MRESEADSLVIVEEIDEDAFKCVVHFAYGNDPRISLQNIAALLSICDKYQILPLLNIANQFFQRSLTANTFCVLFNQSISIKSKFCIDLCVDFLRRTYLEFNRSAHSRILRSSNILGVDAMRVLLQSDYLLIKEEEIFEAYIRWLNFQRVRNSKHVSDDAVLSIFAQQNTARAAAQSLDTDDMCDDVDVEDDDDNDTIKTHYSSMSVPDVMQLPSAVYRDPHNLYKLIRFGLMTNKYFIKHVIPTRLLSDADLVCIMKYFVFTDEGCSGFDTRERGKDTWSGHMGRHMVVKNHGVLTHTGPDRCSQTAMLTMQFDAGVHRWQFKVVQLKQDIMDGSDWTSCIGIYRLSGKERNADDEDCSDWPVNNHFIWDNQQFTGYGFCVHSGKIKVYDNVNEYCVSTDYGVECKRGDVVELIVDMNRLQLKYAINSVDYGEAFHIQAGTYRAAVNLDIPNDSIQLL